MFISNELKILEKYDYIYDIRESFLDILYKATNDLIADKQVFSIDNFSATYYDEFTLETYCHKDIFNTIYLEIDQPLNYKILDKKISTKKKKTKDKITIPELYISIDTIIDQLYESLLRNLDSNNIVWTDDHSVSVKAIVNHENNQVYNFYFKIIPCLTYHNKDNKHGVIYNKNNGTEIEYPELSIKNYTAKNKKTKGKYRDTILMFKNILLKDKSINNLPKEIIEIILYNVPNEMYIDDSKSTLINIVNFIRNNSIKSFKTIDEQDLAFTSIYRSLSHLYVKHIIKIIEKYLILN